jgi:hypothetical protein
MVYSSLVYTPHKQRGITRINFGRIWCDVSSRTRLAGLSVLLRKAKCTLFYSRVLRVV